MKHELRLPGFIPTTVNELMRSVGKRIRAKRGDRDLVIFYSRLQGIPAAQGKRRVDVTITKPNGKFPDPDAIFKSLLDALVHARMLLDDDAEHVVLGPITFERGERSTLVVLEDIDTEQKKGSDNG